MKRQTPIERNGSKLLRQKKSVMFKGKNEEGNMAAGVVLYSNHVDLKI